jgi:tetratricopeptide (TPR) repeat protein
LRPSANAEANELLQRAVIIMRFQYDPLRARTMLERALQLDPNFTEARVYYAATYVIAVEGGKTNDPGDTFRAEEELRHALKEDPQMALAHAMLGAIHFFQGQFDLAGKECRQAVRLSPGDLGGEMWLLIQERFLGNEGAMQTARKLIETEPLFWPARYFLAELLREEGKTAEAVRVYEEVLEQDPQNSTGLCCLARAYLDAGNQPEAWKTLARMRPQDVPNFRVRLAKAQLHAVEGKRALALKEMDEEVLKYADLQPFAALDAAEVYAVLGETDKAIEWLDRSMRKGDNRAAWLRIDPLLANVRQHPRFDQILNSMEFRRQQRNALPATQP